MSYNPAAGAITVAELDGSPSISGVTVIKVANGDLTNNAGVAEIATGGGGGGASAGTPGLTLSTTNNVGSTSSYVATDGTIAAFDATVPATQTYADAAATGSAGKAARRDHKHAMPAVPVKSQLDFAESTDLFSGGAGTSTAWTDFKANQNFTVDDTNSLFEFLVNIGALFTHSASGGRVGALRIVINSAGTPITKYLGAIRSTEAATGDYTAFVGGSVWASGLPAGTNTIKLQYYVSGANTLYCRASTQPNTEYLFMQAIEHKVA